MKKETLKYWILSAAVVGFLGGCKPHAHDGEGDHAAHDHGMHDHEHSHEAPEGIIMPEIQDGQRVFFANLEDGQSVTSPLLVEFGVEGMDVEPAGEIKENSGHHHLLINHDFIATGQVIPAGDSTLIHFGKGQTSTEVNLPLGTHKLTMQFANGAHMSYGEKMSATITVTVEAPAKHMGDK